MFADPTFESLSFSLSVRLEKSALSENASTMPIAVSVLSREASAEMENFGRYRSTELRTAEQHQYYSHGPSTSRLLRMLTPIQVLQVLQRPRLS